MDAETKTKAFNEWLDANSPTADAVGFTHKSFSEAAYTISELGFLGDDLGLTGSDLFYFWRVVEAIKRAGFPDDLKM